MNNAKRTEPTRSLLQGMPYVNAASTDIKARFAAVKKALAEAAKQPTLHSVPAKRSRG